MDGRFKKPIIVVTGGCILVAIVCIIIFSGKSNPDESEYLVVCTPNGKVRGKQVHNETTNFTFWAWEGVPFGQPTSGKNRFQAPLPALPWDGIFEANTSGTPCPPVVHFALDADPEVTSEDCLYLNIYAPAKVYDYKLPVMHYIIGGGFRSGAAVYAGFAPDDLVENEVIVVIASYRIAMLGFLSTGDEVVSGNAGLKDQLLGLKWTNENIKYFGGDPERITLFGASSGGMSVGMFYWNSNAAGLFRAALCSSGCSLTEGLFQKDGRANAFELASYIDPTISPERNTSEELRALLQSVDVDVIIEANKKMDKSRQTGYVIEVDHSEALISERRFETLIHLRTGDFNQVPLLLGDNSEESLTDLATDNTIEDIRAAGKRYDDNITTLIPKSMNVDSSTNSTKIALLIKDTYVGNRSFEDDIVGLLKYYSDNKFGRSILKQAQVVSKFQPVYLYQYSFYGTVSILRKTAVIQGAGKVGHAAEYPQVFKVETYPLKHEDILISKKFARLWTNFAKYLNPTPNITDPVLNNVQWPVVTPDNLQYLDINSVLTVQSNKREKQMKMWDSLFANYSRPPYDKY